MHTRLFDEWHAQRWWRLQPGIQRVAVYDNHRHNTCPDRSLFCCPLPAPWLRLRECRARARVRNLNTAITSGLVCACSCAAPDVRLPGRPRHKSFGCEMRRLK
jgi:hypothetical protein